MGGEPPIKTVGTILAKKGPRHYDATLPNGKIVMAHVPSKRAEDFPEFMPGQRVRLELTTFDFSSARIAGTED